MTTNIRAASAAYDAAFASLVGCKGLLTEPLTERKLEMLRQRIEGAGEQLAEVFGLISDAEAEPAFTRAPVEPAYTETSGNVASLDERRRRGPRP